MAMDKRTDLGRLIEQVKREKGESFGDIAHRARMKGRTITRTYLQMIATTPGPMKSLMPETLEAIAYGLEIPLARVVEAALPSVRLPLPGYPADWSIEAAVEADPELPTAAKRMLLRMLADARAAEDPEGKPDLRAAAHPKPGDPPAPRDRGRRDR